MNWYGNKVKYVDSKTNRNEIICRSESKMYSGNLSSLALWRKPNVVGVLSTQRRPTTHCEDSSQSSSIFGHPIKDCNGKLSFLEV